MACPASAAMWSAVRCCRSTSRTDSGCAMRAARTAASAAALTARWSMPSRRVSAVGRGARGKAGVGDGVGG